MIKKSIYKIFLYIGRLADSIYFDAIHRCFKYIRTCVYSGLYGRRFQFFGQNSTVGFPVNFIKGSQYISIGSNVSIGHSVTLTAWDTYLNQTFTPHIVIGNGCSIGNNAHITAVNNILIGDNVLTGKYILITDNSHGESNIELLDIPPAKRPLASKGQVIIEDNVWIGEKASILPNVTIGRGAIIAANSVVTKDVPPYCVVAGNPARIIKNMDLKIKEINER
jgi:acetyltransferase-like isoleucine patch superfamily enzyme